MSSTDDQQNIVKAVTKTNPSNVLEDYVITGTFTYRSLKYSLNL